jgi:hypothetical protein
MWRKKVKETKGGRLNGTPKKIKKGRGEGEREEGREAPSGMAQSTEACHLRSRRRQSVRKVT